MMVIMKKGYTQDEFDGIMKRLDEQGLGGHPIVGVERTVIAVVGHIYPELADELETMPGVEDTVPISVPYKLSGRQTKPEDTVVRVGDVAIGGNAVVVMAGPCAVESQQQVLETARAVKAAGAQVLRGGAFKPRTSPYSFRGLGEDGLKFLAAAREETGMPIVTELMSVRDIDVVARYADIIQIGTRNAQNFILLEEQHRRHQCDSARQAAQSPTTRRRSEPWHWKVVARVAGGPGDDRGWSGCAHRRGAPESRSRAVGWRAVTQL
jgi:3-deoxy-7-phosphoheptulonate synthase